VHIEGKAYVVYDLLDNRVIAGKAQTAILPLASITKVMTAVSSTLHKDKNATITISPKSIEDGYDLGLKNNQVWSLRELLKYTLIFSSNDGAEAVADSFGSKEVFVTQMNNDAKGLGLSVTFTDPAGRDLHGNIGGKGTALDVAKLFFIARQKIPEILDATTKKRATLSTSSGKVSGIPNTNQEIEDLSGAEASKTGYTDMAGGNLGVIVDVTVGHPVAIIVLGSTREGRFKDMGILYTALRRSVEKSTVDKSQSNH
jgi:D-alanyl-D-alanine carboxypeptidase (penicillin-binding protein 5/6)